MTASPSFRHDVAEWVFGLPVAAALGFTFDGLTDGRSVTRLAWHPRDSHMPGAFQASPIASLADFTGASAGMALRSVGGVGATMD
jgi:acyl-coenzyme A thioesterase PaaI-like protein